MINSWFTLQKCAEVFDSLYRGAILERCVTFRKNELWLIFREHKPLLIHLGTPFQYCLTAREPLSLRRESVRIFPGINNPIVESVGILPAERVIRFQLKNAGRLSLVFLSNRGNVVYEQTGETEYFKKHIQIDPEILQDGPAPEYASIDDDPRFNRFWKRNIADILRTADYAEILSVLKNSNGEVKNGRFVLPPNPGDFDAQVFFDNYRSFIFGYLQDRQFRDAFQRIEKRIIDGMERLQKQLNESQNDDQIRERAEKYRYFADTLNACRHLAAEHRDRFEIPEAYRDPAFPAEIPLSPDSSLQEQIDQYYERSRSAQIRIESGRKRREDLLKAYRELESDYADLVKLDNYRDLQEWKKTHNTVISTGQATEHTERRPYREFLVDGWRIRVGKSAKDNAELTFKHAAKTDLWLHVRHGTGSHVILKMDGKKQVPAKVLNHAAALAARFSEQKHSGLVTVVCTERKYVSRIRGAAPGKVRYQFERDIMAEPLSTNFQTSLYELRPAGTN